ncbi:MAG: serine protease, partial [Pseudomonadota bacterium]
AVSPRNDLALLEIVDAGVRLPPLSIAGGMSGDTGEVSAVGYPMNVDLAQGLEIEDIFKAQPPVKSRGFLSGQRPSRQFDTILHTAPIARGNSGGPLLDGCGRVLGVNSFGADSDGSDAEFYFAVSLRELLPFLRDNDVDPRTNAMPCRSIEELNAAERDRFEQERAEARARMEEREAELREARAQARNAAQFEVMEERETAMAIAMVLLLVAIGCGYTAFQLRENETKRGVAVMFALLATAALVGAVMTWLSRPSFDEIEDRVEAKLNGEDTGDDAGGEGSAANATGNDGTLICTIDLDRSRITGARTDDVEFDWSADGCVNGRTQYGMNGGTWSRAFVPNDEAAVSVNTYNPDTRTFQTDRYLLSRNAMAEAREARSEYKPPACGVGGAADIVGEQQSKLLAILPDRPNERLVYSCKSARKAGSGGGG